VGGWLRFFLRGVAETAEAIVRLREEHRALLQDEGLGLKGLLDLLFRRPLVNVGLIRDEFGSPSLTPPTNSRNS